MHILLYPLRKQACIHFPGIADQNRKWNQVQNILLDIHARCILYQFNSRRGQMEDRPLRDIGNILSLFQGFLSIQSNLFDLLYNLPVFSLLKDMQPAAANLNLCSAGSEGPAEDQLGCLMGNIDESAAARNDAVELADIDIAVLIEFAKAQERLRQAAAPIVPEHIRGVNDRLRVDIV